MNHTKTFQADLDSPHWEFFVRNFGFAVALLVCLGINFVCACTGGPIQLYRLPAADSQLPAVGYWPPGTLNRFDSRLLGSGHAICERGRGCISEEPPLLICLRFYGQWDVWSDLFGLCKTPRRLADFERKAHSTNWLYSGSTIFLGQPKKCKCNDAFLLPG